VEYNLGLAENNPDIEIVAKNNPDIEFLAAQGIDMLGTVAETRNLEIVEVMDGPELDNVTKKQIVDILALADTLLSIGMREINLQ
jgi:hypothetical protein